MSRGLSFGKSKPATKQWVHPRETLLRGHIVYNVKFLGHVEVDAPKGAEVVRDAIRKMKFNKHIKKAEGQKLPKVELTISVDGVTVQEPKYRVIQHQYPLHRISYCADDKSDKKIFTFIAKAADKDQHYCYVFYSDKCAEEITLTIGQAFELAYQKFLENSNKDMDLRRQHLLAQKKVNDLSEENKQLRARITDLEKLVDPSVLQAYDKSADKVSVPPPTSPLTNGTGAEPVVGRQLQNLLLDDKQKAPMNNHVTEVPALAPPPVPSRNNVPPPAPASSPPAAATNGLDVFGQTPFAASPPPVANNPPSLTNHMILAPPAPKSTQHSSAGAPLSTQHSSSASHARGDDPFGMGSFGGSDNAELDQQIQSMDRELLDLQTGFSRGLSIGTTDFDLEDLDPLNKK